MQLLDVVAWIGAGISLWGTGRYIVEINRGNTQPRLASWIAWAVANGVLMAVAVINGNVLAATLNGLAALGNLTVLGLCVYKRAGTRPNNITDWVCLTVTCICMFCILRWPHATFTVAIWAMAANLVATWPTMRHAWQRPQEEAWQLFAANAGANSLGLVGVIAASGIGLGNIAGPLVSTLGNAALLGITLGRGWLTNVTHEVQEEIAEVENYVAGLEKEKEVGLAD